MHHASARKISDGPCNDCEDGGTTYNVGMVVGAKDMSRIIDLVIIGAGGLGREIFAVCEAANQESRRWNVVGFVDDRVNGEVPDCKAQVLGGQEWIRKNGSSVQFICGVGNTRARKRLVQACEQDGGRFSTVVHPDVIVPSTIEIGSGTVIMAGTRFTTQARIGSHTVIYLNCSITHDVVIGDYSCCDFRLQPGGIGRS